MNPEFHCVTCSRLLDLTIDLNTDENGKAVHEQCYVNRVIRKGARHCEQFPRTFLEAAQCIPDEAFSTAQPPPWLRRFPPVGA
jgi:hypothetical protein